MQLRLLFVLLLSFTITGFINAQTLSGKVTNTQNEPVVGATIKLTGGAKGTTTNVEGRFSLSLTAGKKYEIEITAINYQTKTISDIEAVNGAFNDLEVTLDNKTAELAGVVVTAKRTTAKMETAASVIQFQKNTNTVASVISAESIKRSPDKNTGEVLKRTPGASLIDGKFLVVRGLADRYNQAMLNGILLTSTEPDRKTFSFDIIPSQMIDNIIINKAFVPEYPGEWAGGLIQVNTKDIPAKNFFNIQIGTGFNAQTIGKDFYKAKGGKLDWLGIEDGTRGLPKSYTTKSAFNMLTPAQKTAIGKEMNNDWAATPHNVSPNISFQTNGGFTGSLFGKKIGGIIGLNYNKSNRFIDILNQGQTLVQNEFSQNFSYHDNRYVQEVTVGALASVSLQLNAQNKVALKSIINVNTNNAAIQRSGINNATSDDVYGGELTFKENTFFTTQLSGEHSILTPLKLKWYGAFNILDGYSPDQRRYQYTRATGTQNPYQFLIGNSLAQESGSRVFQSLNDYIYTAGGDLSYNFDINGQKQTVKTGYMLQVKDRLFDAQLFANYLPRDNAALRQQPIDKIFAPENFGDGSAGSTLFAFNSINNKNFRYLSNTILNAGFLQFDNQVSSKVRLVWGLRIENFDQLLGTVKKWDTDRHKHTNQTDFLPGLNATLKLNNKTNLRLTGSQTVIRPEQRELAALTLYDFELNSAIMGNPNLVRTKVSNADLRYEIYPRSGEMLTLGTFYKYFDKPIEQNLQQGGAIFEFQNPDKATAYGAEIEFRKRLDVLDVLRNFTIQANAAYIKSEVTDKKRDINRPLQGQSPYLLNFALMYDLEKAGLNATMLYNQIGKRIYLVGDIPAAGGDGSADVWEAPRPVLDFQLTKKVLRTRGELRLNISDILNQTQRFYQNKDDNTNFQKDIDRYRFTRKFGTTFSLTFNYSL
ncbi:carboxypeptidase regulatory-like domain-containing protein [Niabella sp.]|uniref:outer membrane beta-barrel protein n=1 Tax=Niabella sp. TaxID=1962976 RepID=UPI00260623E4|nr:carboxypeptidase regulatory-like domain-containing protein [Niabella sp.]